MTKKRSVQLETRAEPPVSTDDAVRDGRSSVATFPIVGVGASAGGFEALTQLLKALPLDTGMGFVLGQHLDPKYERALTQILSRSTSWPVCDVMNNQAVLATSNSRCCRMVGRRSKRAGPTRLKKAMALGCSRQLVVAISGPLSRPSSGGEGEGEGGFASGRATAGLTTTDSRIPTSLDRLAPSP